MSKLSRDIGMGLTILKRIVLPELTRVAVHVTNDCNQKCATCNIWAINKDDPDLKKEELTTDEFGSFCYSNPYIVWMTLSGGEPYLKKDLKGILDACCTIPSLRLISITTNGGVPEKIEDDIRHFLSNKRTDITIGTQVSFEGPRELHDVVSGTPGSYDKAVETLKRLKALADKDSRVRLAIGFTDSKFTQGRFLEMYHSLDGSRPNPGKFQISTGQEADYYNWKEPRDVVPASKLIVKDIKDWKSLLSLKERLDPYAIVEQLYYRKAIQMFTKGVSSPRCVACQYSVTIDSHWNVHPCLFMFTKTLANIRNLGLSSDVREVLRDTEVIWKPLVNDCSIKDRCWTMCEHYMAIVARPWRAL